MVSVIMFIPILFYTIVLEYNTSVRITYIVLKNQRTVITHQHETISERGLLHSFYSRGKKRCKTVGCESLDLNTYKPTIREDRCTIYSPGYFKSPGN